MSPFGPITSFAALQKCGRYRINNGHAVRRKPLRLAQQRRVVGPSRKLAESASTVNSVMR
jgi:hypothetical protein